MEPEGKLSEYAARMGGGAGMRLRDRIAPTTEGGLMVLISALEQAAAEQETEIKALGEKLGPVLSAQVAEEMKPGGRAVPTTTSAVGQHLLSVFNAVAHNTDILRSIRFALEL